MFKDFNKYLSTSLKVYLFVLVIIVILKLVGLDYFGIDINNATYLKFNDFILNHKLENIYYSLTLYFYVYMYISISNNDNSKKCKIASIFYAIGTIILKFIDAKIANSLIIYLLEFTYIIFMCMAYNKFKDNK